MEQRDDSGEVPIRSRVHKRERLLLRRMSVSRHREAHIHGCLDSRRSHGTELKLRAACASFSCAVPQASRPAVRRDVRGQQA